MDTELLVDRRFGDGEKLIRQLVRDGFDVSVAIWAKTSDDGLWSLYVGSGSVTPRNLGASYQRLYASLSKIPDPSLSLSDVKLVNTANPIAQAAIRIRDQLPERMSAPSRAELIGGLAVEEIYIYPQLGPMTPNEVMQTVIDLMTRRGLLQSSEVTLRDGSKIPGVPCGIKTSGSIVQIELLDASGASRTIALDQIANIQ